MDAGGLASMSHPGFMPNNGMLPTGGLASRRGGQGIKPLSFDTLKAPGANVEPSVPTPRTARGHLLAGLRTAPKSATATTFAASGTVANQPRNRNSMVGYSNDVFNGPKTAMPRGYGQQTQATSPQQQQQNYNGLMGFGQQQQQQQAPQAYTADQILAPPEVQIDQSEEMDPHVYANLVNTNMYLAQQQQRLQQQLLALQAAQQQFQNLNLGNANPYQMYQQQQQAQQQQAHLQQLQQQLQQAAMLKNLQQAQAQQLAQAQQQQQQQVYTVFDPVTGQTQVVFDQGNNMQQQQQQQWIADQYAANLQAQAQAQQPVATPRVQVSPPPTEARPVSFRNPSPPRRFESPEQAPTPLPPPSANAFRRGHKKSTSMSNSAINLPIATELDPKSPGPKTAQLPLTPARDGGFLPGQGRAGEHPVRQPKGPPSFDQLRDKPTSKHEGSKNFVNHARQSALSSLVRAGLTRRQASNGSNSGSISPISETAEELPTPLTEDDESVSGRSGSGSLNGDEVESSLPSSRTSTGSWGAIGSDRPSSRQNNARKSVDSLHSASGDETASTNSFASMFKPKAQTPDAASGQRKAPMLVLNRAEKRKNEVTAPILL